MKPPRTVASRARSPRYMDLIANQASEFRTLSTRLVSLVEGKIVPFSSPDRQPVAPLIVKISGVPSPPYAAVAVVIPEAMYSSGIEYRIEAAASAARVISLLRRHQELGLPEALLRVSYSEHPPLPRPGAAPTTFYYIIPTLPQAGEGFLRTNQT